MNRRYINTCGLFVVVATVDLDDDRRCPAARRAADRLPISSAGTARETRAHRSTSKPPAAGPHQAGGPATGGRGRLKWEKQVEHLYSVSILLGISLQPGFRITLVARQLGHLFFRKCGVLLSALSACCKHSPGVSPGQLLNSVSRRLSTPARRCDDILAPSLVADVAFFSADACDFFQFGFGAVEIALTDLPHHIGDVSKVACFLGLFYWFAVGDFCLR